jgi:hypothetical protein
MQEWQGSLAGCSKAHDVQISGFGCSLEQGSPHKSPQQEHDLRVQLSCCSCEHLTQQSTTFAPCTFRRLYSDLLRAWIGGALIASTVAINLSAVHGIGRLQFTHSDCRPGLGSAKWKAFSAAISSGDIGRMSLI